MDIRAALMCGIDFPIPECSLIVHQPTIKEIAFVGERDFLIGAQTLGLNKSMFVQDKTHLDEITNFQIFMTIMRNPETKQQKECVLKVLQLLFATYNITLTPNSLLFLKDDKSIIVDNDNFEFLREACRSIFCMKDGPMDQQAFNPANKKAQEIAKKLMRGREIVAAQKGNSNSSIFTQYVSILTVGLNSMSLKELTELTMFQLYDLIERYGLYTNWDLDIKQRLAGGKPEKAPDNWMKNIHN